MNFYYLQHKKKTSKFWVYLLSWRIQNSSRIQDFIATIRLLLKSVDIWSCTPFFYICSFYLKKKNGTNSRHILMFNHISVTVVYKALDNFLVISPVQTYFFIFACLIKKHKKKTEKLIQGFRHIWKFSHTSFAIIVVYKTTKEILVPYYS